jgi:hypothetical protein
MSKWTNGEWLIADGSDGFVYALNEQGTNRFWLNVQSAGKGKADADEVMANAKLIAQAPVLADELANLIAVLNGDGGTNPNSVDRCKKALQDAGYYD